MIRVFKGLKKYFLHFIITFLLIYLQVGFDLKLPEYMARIVDEGIVGNKGIEHILSLGLNMIGFTFLSLVCIVLSSYINSIIAVGYSRDLKRKLFKKIMNFSHLNRMNFDSSTLIVRTNDDIENIKIFISSSFRLSLYAPLLAIGAIVKIFNINYRMSFVISFAVIIQFLIFIIVVYLISEKYNEMQILKDKMSSVSSNHLKGAMSIRAFNRESEIFNEFEKININFKSKIVYVNKIIAHVTPLVSLVMNITIVAIVFIASISTGNTNSNIGNIMAFIQYSSQILMAFMMMFIMFFIFPKTIVSLKRVKEILDIKEEELKSKNKFVFNKKIEFKDVAFNYMDSDRYSLVDVNFEILKGENVGIIGKTGSGKSTLVKLLNGFLSPSKGKILIDGEDINLLEVNSGVSYMPQKTNLFKKSLDDNILFFSKTDELEKIKKISQIDFSLKEIIKKGQNISKGQAQRVAIARTITKNADIYIFDDPFSSIDLVNEKKIRNNILDYKKDKTIIFVTQRLKTIMDLDKIILLDESRIIKVGTHSELLEEELYREILKLQS